MLRVFFAANARKLLAQSEIIVLCDFEDADKWQQYVLRQEISDCFIIRPVHNPGYLKVQIWRAIRSQMPLGNDDDKKAETVIAHESQKQNLQFSGLRVLVLEEDDPSAEFITDMLIGFGFSVVRAPSVIDAVQKYEGRKFDLFLVDLMMPGISCSDVIRAVNDTLNDTAAPIIVMSAFSEDELVQDCIAEGASDYVIKPITRSRLYPRLVSALENRRL